jgi:glutathione reductase (NADPH)
MIDVMVIGAGSAGLVTAKQLAASGKSVALVENDTIGGTCVSYGCVPKKLWHRVSAFGGQMDAANDYGWSVSESSFDWEAMQQAIRGYVQKLNARHYQKCMDAGVTVIRGQASFVSPTTICINNTHYTAGHSVICVGSTAKKEPIPGADYCDTSYDFFSWPKQPQSVAIWGGGYIAVELASILQACGSRVHIICRQSQVLGGFDADLRAFIMDRYREKGIHIHTNSTIDRVDRIDEDTHRVVMGSQSIRVNRVIQAIGRRPNTDALLCESAGIMRDANGAIIVNDQYATSQPTVSALGDCIGGLQLTPVAIAQARDWFHRVWCKGNFPVDFSTVPTAVFSHPEIGTVGLTEDAAREQYADVSTKTLTFTPLTAVLSAQPEPVFIKLIMSGGDLQVRGLHIVADSASEIIQSLAVAIQKGITKADLDKTMALHPSIMEELVTIY